MLAAAADVLCRRSEIKEASAKKGGEKSYPRGKRERERETDENRERGISFARLFYSFASPWRSLRRRFSSPLA